jgi:hypothetical protein
MIERGGATGRGLLRLSVLSLRHALIGTGEMDAFAVDAMAALLDDVNFCWQSQIMVAAKARRPR